MYHAIRFVANLWLDLERSPRLPLERLLLRRGTCVRAQLQPHVLETPDGLVEAADLFFDDGTTVRGVPFAAFCFAD
jgi:hypothetical protein